MLRAIAFGAWVVLHSSAFVGNTSAFSDVIFLIRKKQLQKQQERAKNKKSKAKNVAKPPSDDEDEDGDADGFFDDEPSV